MSKFLGENIRRLRRAKNITQEKLAERLNISCQAISKWERGESYPDICMLIPLASYFEVSTDELLGVNEEKNLQKVKEYIDEYDRLSYLGKDKEKFDLIKKAYGEFPDNYRIMDKYIWMLVYDPYVKYNPATMEFGLHAHVDEIEKLCERIMEESFFEKIRFSTLTILSDVYEIKGQVEKAREILEWVPEGYYFSRGEMQQDSYPKGSAEYLVENRKNLNKLVSALEIKIRNCALYSNAPPLERILQYNKLIDFLGLIYEDGDYGFSNYTLSEAYVSMGNKSLDAKDYDKAMEYYDLGLSHAKQYDELPDVTMHTSFLVKGCEFVKRGIYSGCQSNQVFDILSRMDNNKFYESINSFDSFVKLKEKYRPFAKQYKEYK